MEVLLFGRSSVGSFKVSTNGRRHTNRLLDIYANPPVNLSFGTYDFQICDSSFGQRFDDLTSALIPGNPNPLCTVSTRVKLVDEHNMLVSYWRKLVIACSRFFDAPVEQFIIICMVFLELKNRVVSALENYNDCCLGFAFQAISVTRQDSGTLGVTSSALESDINWAYINCHTTDL